MDTIRSEITQLHEKRIDDEVFIARIGALAEREGDKVFPIVLNLLTSLNLSSAVAQNYWQRAVEHRLEMQANLNRDVTLITAFSDLLAHNGQKGFNPFLIDTKSYEEILHQSVRDVLTGLNNRAYFDQVFEQQLSLALRYNTDLSLLFLDIDNFKDINDQYGHQAGDSVLQNIATIIEKEKRDSDIAIRYGGEEFVLLMPHTGSINGIILAERIRLAVSATVITFEEYAISVTISGGLASYPADGDTSAAILAVADQALYQSKGAGKNVISLFKEDKRRYLRVKFHNPVFVKELDIDAKPTYAGRGKDICIGGILFQNSEPLEIGSQIQIHTRISSENRLLLIGTVIRVESFGPDDYDIGVAISFKEMEKIAREEIAGLLRADQ